MSYFNHLVYGIPFKDIEALATEQGLLWSGGTNPMAYSRMDHYDKVIPGGYEENRLGAELDELCESLNILIPSELRLGNRIQMYDDEGFYPAMLGWDIHSQYMDEGPKWAKEASVGTGYMLTPELLVYETKVRTEIVSYTSHMTGHIAVVQVHW